MSFAWKGRPIAAGTITQVVDGMLAVVRITSGSLARASRLDRVEIRAEARLRPPPARLRIGHPGAGRASALIACDGFAPGRRWREAGYRLERTGDRTQRLARAQPGGPRASWPDTIEIRFFDDTVDEEIAFERGEIDAAVFWPGELSPAMRRQARGEDMAWATRTRGVVVAWMDEADGPANGTWPSDGDRRAFAWLNHELFRDDLLPRLASVPDSAGASGAATVPTRYEVDPSCPAAAAMAAALQRGAGANVRGASRIVHLGCVDVPAGAADSVIAAALAREGAAAGAPPAPGAIRVVPLFAMRCPVVIAPDRRREIDAMGTDAVVELLECVPRGEPR
jgi:hypothetical protein